MRTAQIALAAGALLMGAVATARAQTPDDPGRRQETMRSRDWMYMPRFEYRMPRIRERQFALEDRLRDRRFELENRLRDRRFELRDRLRELQLDRQDRLFRRQMELHDRLGDRMRERMDRLHEMRPFRFRRYSRTI
jgi:hypothetical protein